MCANRSKKRRRKNVLAKKKIKKSRANNLRSLKKRKKKKKGVRTRTRRTLQGGTLFDVSRRCEAAKRAFIVSTVFEPKLSSTTLES